MCTNMIAHLEVLSVDERPKRVSRPRYMSRATTHADYDQAN